MIRERITEAASAVRRHWRADARSERGASTVEWILIVVALAAIVAIAVTAITGYVNSLVADLPG